jgi:hypothetical protein
MPQALNASSVPIRTRVDLPDAQPKAPFASAKAAWTALRQSG